MFGTGGYDKREERRERQALPICENCPNIDLREALKAARASKNQIDKSACALAEQLLRRAGCPGPQEVAVSSADDDFSSTEGMEEVCGNRNAELARTITADTHAAVLAERP